MICVCQSEVSLQFSIFRIITPNGWFFAVFKKSSSTIQTDLDTAHVKQYFHVEHNLRCLKCFF